jgi:RNA polymerase primary sigma factor
MIYPRGVGYIIGGFMKTVSRVNTHREALSEDDTLSCYLREITSYPVLSKGETNRYAKRAAAGDETAKEKLILANLRYVVSVAKRYQNLGLPLQDLISEGNIGLMKAAEKFDGSRGCRFTSFAVWWVKQAIFKAISWQSRAIRLPSNRVTELIRIEKARRELRSSRGKEPETGEITKFLNMDKDRIAKLLQVAKTAISLDTPVIYDEESSYLSDFLQDSSNESPDKVAIQKSLKNEINGLLETLPKREADVLRHRFGLNGHYPLSLQSLGHKFRLSKERVRQIENQALEHLRHTARIRSLDAYIN